MKISELIETSNYLAQLKSDAKKHYPETDTEDESLLQFLARSVLHAKDDDAKQNNDIAILKSKINNIHLFHCLKNP